MNRLVLTAISVLALALAATPASAAESDDWQNAFSGQPALLSIEVGPNAVLATLHDITVQGSVASDTRWAIDNLEGVGDGDGTVSEQEVVTFEVLVSAAINENLPTTFDEEFIKIDGQGAPAAEGTKAVELVKVDVKDAEGTVDSTEDIKTDIRVKLRFDSVDSRLSSHSVEFSNVYGDFTGYDSDEAPPVEVHISGYSSWDIHAESIDPSEAHENLDEDTLVFRNADIAYFQSEGAGLFFEIRGDPDTRIEDESEGAPGPGALAVLGAVGAMLVAMRRRAA